MTFNNSGSLQSYRKDLKNPPAADSDRFFDNEFGDMLDSNRNDFGKTNFNPLGGQGMR